MAVLLAGCSAGPSGATNADPTPPVAASPPPADAGPEPPGPVEAGAGTAPSEEAANAGAVANHGPPPTAEPVADAGSVAKESAPLTCAPLPARRPRDLSIRFLRVIVPHGGDPRREGLELHAEGDCPKASGPRAKLTVLPCRRVASGVLDTVYFRFVRAGFGSLKADGPPGSSPHYGTRVLEVVWDGHACDLVDSPQTPIRKSSERVFFDLIDAVVGAGAP